MYVSKFKCNLLSVIVHHSSRLKQRSFHVHNVVMQQLSEYNMQTIFSRCVRCFNCLPQAVVAAETVAEFKRKLSNVDLSSF